MGIWSSNALHDFHEKESQILGPKLGKTNLAMEFIRHTNAMTSRVQNLTSSLLTNLESLLGKSVVEEIGSDQSYLQRYC